MQAQLIRTYTAHRQAVQTLVILPDGKRAVSSGETNALKVWSLASDEPTGKLTGHNARPCCLATFPDGEFIVSGARNGELKIWNAESNEIVRTLAGHENDTPITALTTSLDGKHIVSGAEDTTIRIWDSVTGALLHTCEGHHTPVQALTVTPDNQYVIAGETGNGASSALRVWKIDTGLLEREFTARHRGVNGLSFDTDRDTLITSSTEGDVTVWDWQSGEIVRVIETHLGSAVTALMPNKRYAVIGTQKPVLTLWNLENGKRIHTLDEPSNWVSSLAVTPDGRLIMAGCRDGMINVYRLRA